MEAEQKIDMKRHEKIDGIQAIKLFLEGERLLSEGGIEFRIDPTFNKLYYKPWAHECLSDLSFNDIAASDWYIKKPFDVRAEMLARPNEWVGAFKSDNDKWYKTGFDSSEMSAVAAQVGQKETRPVYSDDHVYLMSQAEIDKCIPIEDVPKEELS